jgi:hypothetical protein
VAVPSGDITRGESVGIDVEGPAFDDRPGQRELRILVPAAAAEEPPISNEGENEKAEGDPPFGGSRLATDRDGRIDAPSSTGNGESSNRRGRLVSRYRRLW